MFYVYIIYNQNYDKFYIGQTQDLKSRLFKHKHGLAKYTSKYGDVWALVYYEKYNSRKEAMNREKFIKKQKSKDFYKKLSGNSAG